MTDETFVSLEALLEGHYDKDLADLPDELRQAIEKEPPLLWDSLAPDQRLIWAQSVDYERNPATDGLHCDVFDRIVNNSIEKRRLEKEIIMWQSKTTPTASDRKIQQEEIAPLQAKLDDIIRQEKQRNAFEEMALSRSEGRKSSDPRIKQRERQRIIGQALNNIPWDETLKRDKHHNEIAAITEWLADNRSEPTTGDRDMLKAFPMDFKRQDQPDDEPGKDHTGYQQAAPEDRGKPVYGHKGIAEFFGVTERQAKNYAKKKGFPITKSASGSVHSYENDLQRWNVRRKTK